MYGVVGQTAPCALDSATHIIQIKHHGTAGSDTISCHEPLSMHMVGNVQVREKKRLSPSSAVTYSLDPPAFEQCFFRHGLIVYEGHIENAELRGLYTRQP
jgi:hypothetical protein